LKQQKPSLKSECLFLFPVILEHFVLEASFLLELDDELALVLGGFGFDDVVIVAP